MSSPVNIILGVVGAQGVLNAVDGVRNSMGGLTATVLGTTSALGGLKSGLDLGGEFADLSARTGQAVRGLVIFRRALDNASIGGANAAQFIGLLQKAIAGLNEEGGKTGDVFTRLGLDPQRLKQLGLTDQVGMLTSSFAKIVNPAERAALAMQLFGRSGAAMLQLLGDSSAMAIAERDAGRLADRLQRNATAFDEMGDRLSIAKVRLQEFWVVAAEKAMPVLSTMADVLNNLNPASLAATANYVTGIFAVAGGIKLVEKMNMGVWSFATNPAVSGAGQAFAQKFVAPFTATLSNTLRFALPVILASLIGGAIIDGITQAKLERDAAEVAAANAAARESQRQRDALRNAQSLAEVDLQRKKTAQEIADIEKLATTQQIGIRTSYDPERKGTGGATRTPIIGLTEEQTQRLAELRRLQATIESDRPKAIVAANAQATADAKRLADATEVAEELHKQAQSYREAAESARYAIATDEQKLELLARQRDRADALLESDSKAARLKEDVVALAAAQEKFDANILSIEKERSAVQQSITDEKKRQAEADKAAAEAAKQAELTTLRVKAEIAKFALEDRQIEIQRALVALGADFARTEAEKWAERKKHLQDAVAAAQAYLEAMRAQRAEATTDEGRQLGDANVHAAQQDLFNAQSQLGGVGPNPNNWQEQVLAGITAVKAAWGTMAQQIAAATSGTLNSAMQNTSDLLYNWASGAMSFKEAWNGAIRSVGQNFLRMSTDMVSKMIWRATVDRALTALGVTTHVAGEAAKTSATTAGAGIRLAMVVKEALATVYHGAVSAFKAMAGIPYIGPILGAAALAGALALGLGLVGKIGHADGGLITGPGGPTEDRIPAMLSNGEFVVRTSAVDRFGPEFFSSLNSGALDLSKLPNSVARPSALAPRQPGGGLAGAGSDSRPLNIALLDSRDQDAVERFIRDPRSETHIMRVVQKNRRALGVKV